ncbi:putative gustatory receptor 28b [Solenopsis invicta]|uniref:putative gustatory receptor 28b n=1 Tax=Solenopsis invicta TaxID=13686 RepID=UPI00193D66D9|nr:putative gustatory receptor 28b [Solenopsis invicta]
MFKSSKFQGSKSKKKGNIWQLFRATNFESLMYPCFTFCRILGIFPYNINAFNIKTCKPCYILSIIIICVFCICELISLYEINISNYVKQQTRSLQVNCFYIFGGFIPVVTFILSKPRMRLIQTILKVSLRLPSESYQNQSKLIHAKDIIGPVLIVVEELILFSTLQSSVLQRILTTYIILVTFQMDMLYMNCVCVIKACFKQINDNLMNLVELVTNDEPYIFRGIYNNKKNPLVLMALEALKKQHLVISDTVQELNMIFSLQLLLTAIHTFVEVTFILYFYLMRWKIGMVLFSSNEKIYDMFLIVATIYYSIKMGLIIWACETSKNQAIEINTTVHSVLNSISDKQIKRELQLFSLQLMHRKNIFSTKWFNMDGMFLTAMVGSIAKKLLILIEFLFIMSNSCSGNSIINS